MVDTLTPAERSEVMRRVRSKNTAPELAVRKITYSLGYRYRLHLKNLPGKPDLAFPGKKKAIFVHGCFWHQHGATRCKKTRVPKSNTDYWIEKLQGNVKRDRRNRRRLKKLGWETMIVWECEVVKTLALKRRIDKFLGEDS